ncbi:AraC family transcriptional regulator [Microvirga sp. STS02]|uniref:helix-turn-helix domain-containing protein n=1 Tax=Hymenobacter negativus TaxID=2795026 RepID=UPI0018DE8BA8|nr:MULTISPECIES: helix-turn-helix domain-containing protein [Bacteria]MBH8570709.1 AraC family transcriptional regulator [Hymenobacter negativus]MBR7210446.1 AraC family transcriptional regulator [Microvirga sp. STS02]
MQHQEFAPPEELRNTIKCFWHNRRDFGDLPSTFEVQPDGYAEIIFQFGSALSIATPDGWQPLASPFLMGLLNQPALLRTAGPLEIIGVRCFPWTVFDVLGLPPNKAGGRLVEHPIAQLQAPLAELMQAGRLAEALAQLTGYFLQAGLPGTDDPLLLKAGAAMREANGTLPVSQVAAAAHATVRTLERKFKQAVGHTVKDVAGLMRFEQVRNHLWRHPAASLAGLAQELGYADQAHLSREFKRYSGTTPAAFARQARHGQQAISHDFVAFVQA